MTWSGLTHLRMHGAGVDRAVSNPRRRCRGECRIGNYRGSLGLTVLLMCVMMIKVVVAMMIMTAFMLMMFMMIVMTMMIVAAMLGH